jgi:hypothetical protein
MAKERYSASMLDLETTDCFFILQEIKQEPKNTANLDVERRSSGSLAQSESQKALSCKELSVYQIPWSIEPFK